MGAAVVSGGLKMEKMCMSISIMTRLVMLPLMHKHY